MNDIYADELKHLYQQQTEARDLLKAESAKLMRELPNEISAGSIDTEIVGLMRKLHGQLQNTKGKKVYGYLPKDTKRTVDEIFFRLSQNDSIQQMYKLWCEMEQSKHDFYSSAKVDFPAMVDNEQFRSVKNMIVKAADEVQLTAPVSETICVPEESETSAPEKPEQTDKGVTDEPVAKENSTDAFASAAFGLLVCLSRIISDDYDKSQRRLSSQVDHKLRRIIDRKKQEIGIKSENGQSY